MHFRLLPLLIISVTLSLLLGCTDKDSKVRLTVAVKTNQGDPIEGATISLDGKNLGNSDTTGNFQTEIKLAIQSRKRLEVKKDSTKYYFAPYWENFVVGDHPKQDVNINATLYFVPKPVVDGQDNVASNEALNEAVNETVSETPGDEPKAKPAKADKKGKKDKKDKAAPIEEARESDQIEDVAIEPTPVGAGDVVDDSGKMVYPKPDRPNKGETIFTVHVVSGDQPVGDAQLFIGQTEEGDLRAACLTNPRGRCVIRFEEKPTGPVTFVVKKKGYETKSVNAAVATKGQLRVQLTPGQTIDIFAITKSYNHIQGLADVEVFVKGKKVGATDHFGHYAHVYHGRADDLVAIALKPSAYLPETYETDFLASGPLTLVRYFTPVRPPPVHMTLLQVQPAGQIGKKDLEAFEGSFDQALQAAAKKHLFSSSAFLDFPLPILTNSAKRMGKTPTDMLRRGWQGTDLKASVDALLLPTLLIVAKPVLELSVVDSKGQVLAAAKEEMDSLSDKASIDRAVGVIAKKIVRTFPFEGAILGKDADKVTINLGHASGRGIKAGDELEVFGMQAGKLGRTLTHKKIATIVVREIHDESSQAAVIKLMPRSTISRGDLIVLRNRKEPEVGNTFVQVEGNIHGATPEALPQANVYLNDLWLGATDDAGRVYLDVTGAGTLKVIKHGFAEFSRAVKLGGKGKLTVSMKRETAFLRIDSKPSGAAVRIDGEMIGKTPVTSPIPIPAGFIKLEVEGPPGYKIYSSVLELDQGTLDLGGANAIVLDQDLLVPVDQLVKNGQFEQAVAKLNEVPKGHSQYLEAQHLAGELYLTKMDQPAKAAEAFGTVTKDPAVRQFSDKRFIGSHIDEGIALFMTAEKLIAANPDDAATKEAAKAHYIKALEVLTAVEPQLRFVAVNQYAQAVHNVDFHIALARHKLWLATQDPQMLAETVRTWRSYLQGSARSVPVEGSGKIYVENAEVYFRQAQASQLARVQGGESAN